MLKKLWKKPELNSYGSLSIINKRIERLQNLIKIYTAAYNETELPEKKAVADAFTAELKKVQNIHSILIKTPRHEGIEC